MTPGAHRERFVVVAIVVLLATAVIGLSAGGGRPADRAAALERQLRCPVCQQVSIADSPAETAVAMRRTVAEQVAAGRSDAQVLAYFRDRYGEWVLLDPAAGSGGWWWWVLPALAAVVGVSVVLGRAGGGPPVARGLSDVERRRVAEEVARLRSGPDDEDDGP